ncbi:MAG: hypothetical protein ACKVKR_03385, partial [Pseudomonadales bacterium]
VQSGVGSNIKPETFMYIVNNYMDSLGVDWDKLYAKANQLRMDGKVSQANQVVTAAQQMFGTLQLLNTGVNVEPRMLTAQVVKNPIQELLGALGVKSMSEVVPEHIHRRVNSHEIMTYDQIYPEMESGFLLNDAKIPESWQKDWDRAEIHQW